MRTVIAASFGLLLFGTTGSQGTTGPTAQEIKASQKSIVERALAAKEQIPKPSRYSGHKDVTQVRFLDSLNDLLDLAAQAESWSAEQVDMYYLATTLASDALDVGYQTGLAAATGEESCSSKCLKEKKKCVAQCKAHGSAWKRFKCGAECGFVSLVCYAGCLIPGAK